MNYEKLRRIILTLDADIDLDQYPKNAHIMNDVGLDSIQLMELIGAIEDEYDIEVPERKVRDLQHIDEIVAFIDEMCFQEMEKA